MRLSWKSRRIKPSKEGTGESSPSTPLQSSESSCSSSPPSTPTSGTSALSRRFHRDDPVPGDSWGGSRFVDAKHLEWLQQGHDARVQNVVTLLLRASEVPEVIQATKPPWGMEFRHMTASARRDLLIRANDRLRTKEDALDWYIRALELTL